MPLDSQPLDPGTRPARLPRLRTLVAVSAVALVPAFAGTGALVRLHREHQTVLAERWVDRGEEALARNSPLEAAEAYRTALSYSRENAAYQLRLAQALARADRAAEARAYLRTLAARDPSSGAVNLELARLAARSGDREGALRHYHLATDGYWPAGAAGRRRTVRLELARYLAARGERARAAAELMALAASQPADAALYVETASALAGVGAHAPALDLFTKALAIDPASAAALQGAGRAAFEAGDYRLARRLLSRYVRAAPGAAAEEQALLDTVTDLITLDARAPRLTSAERARRAARAFGLADSRARCLTSTGAGTGTGDPGQALLDRLAAARPRATAARLLRSPDAIDPIFELALEAERMAADRCGQPTGPDRALLTLARHADEPVE